MRNIILAAVIAATSIIANPALAVEQYAKAGGFKITKHAKGCGAAQLGLGFML